MSFGVQMSPHLSSCCHIAGFFPLKGFTLGYMYGITLSSVLTAKYELPANFFTARQVTVNQDDNVLVCMPSANYWVNHSFSLQGKNAIN